MKIKHLLVASILLCAPAAFAQQIDPLTKAMLNGYEELLRENPKDYQTLYERAAQYYQLSQYDKAFNDIAKALEYTPEKETAMACQELSLLADISIAVKDYQKALTAVDKALQLNPDSYPDIYKRGNILLYLNQPQEAYKTFQSMQRLKSRSQESLFGMAKAAIMMDNAKEAEELMKQGADFDPTSYITYCRLGDLYHDMKQDEKAATNYLMALSLARNPQRPIQSLVDLSRVNYPAFNTAIDYAISKTDNKVPLYFIKSNVAYNSGNYNDAKGALEALLKIKEGREPAVYALMADNELALNNPAEALKNIDLALQSGDNADMLISRSQALRASGNPAQALIETRRAQNLKPSDPSALLLETAKAAIDAGEAQSALDALNELVMSDPENLEPLILRGYVYETMLGNGKQAVNDYQRASNMEADTFPNVAYKALAKAKSGKKIDADEIMDKALQMAVDKDAFYIAAVYYAQTGNLEKASEWLNKALSAGYQNQYNIRSANTANLSIAPIRHLLK